MRCGKIYGNGQQDEAECVFDAVHPVACFRQDMAAECADDDERYAGAECQDIKSKAAQYGIAGLADIAQSKCQRRRNARADNQGRQNTHDKDGNDFAAG